MAKYNHAAIEQKWQERWRASDAHTARDHDARPKAYLLIEFPFLSGDGLHVGHLRSYTAMDVIARKRRMEGKNVLYPIGWDAFGLPAENYAIKIGQHPRVATEQNIANFRRQLTAMGFSFDWSREVNTSDPAYYKWTQWIFLKLLEHGLAYKARVPINWCPSCTIGLANEEAVGGVCERCGGPVEQREKEQWMLRITAYVDKLLAGLDTVDYIERAKVQQRNWIGKSEGAEIAFSLRGISGQEDDKHRVTVFTTRPDTLFGVTFLVVSPEVAKQWMDVGWQAPDSVRQYVRDALAKREMDRLNEEREKTGVDTGVRAVHPGNGEEIPVWVADYVLGNYGTGAIMAVPAHDERDYAFAQTFGLPIRHVIAPVMVDHANPHRPGDPIVRRTTVQCIVKHWTHDEYIGMRWKEFAWQTFVIGGVEDGEALVDAVRREVVEETGYTDMRIIRQLGGPIVSHYHASHKCENRVAEVCGFLVELQSDARQPIAQREDAKHEVCWIPRDAMPSFVRGAEVHELWRRIDGADDAYGGDGELIGSGMFTGMWSEDAKRAITEKVGGKSTVTYKLRDWVFSRQRYWGEPIPVVFCAGCATAMRTGPAAADPHRAHGIARGGGPPLRVTRAHESQSVIIGGMPHAIVPVPEDQLPVTLPEVERYQPTDTGESPLANMTEWVNTTCPQCGGPARRETDVMPNWAGSSWYFLRYCDSKNDVALADPSKLRYWLPVDWYNGGMEHTTLHLLYSRFWNLFLHDIGAVPVAEPYAKRTSHGLILAEGGEKMSKSRGNVVNPDAIVAEYGADAVRLYEMFIGPFDQPVPWSTNGLVGCRRFLDKVAAFAERVEPRPADGSCAVTDRLLHRTMKKVTEDIEAMRFNTAVSAMMEYANALSKRDRIAFFDYVTFLVLLAPFAPHLCEELHEQLERREGFVQRQTQQQDAGERRSGHTLADHPWPPYDPALTVDEEIDLVVQVNGKVRATIRVPAGIGEADAMVAARADANVAKYLVGKEPTKVIFVPGKLLNVVV